MTRRTAWLSLGLWLAWASLAHATPFLDPGPGAATLGGALAPLVEDPSAALWNPARLARLPGALGLIVEAQPLGAHALADGSFAAARLRWGALSLAAWGARGLPTLQERRRVWGGAGALGLGLVQLGLGARRLELERDGTPAQGLAWDLGISTGLLNLVSLSLVLQDALVTRLQDAGGGLVQTFAPALRAGGVLRLGSFALSAEGTLSESGPLVLRWGAQVKLIGLLAIRVGWQADRWGWGLGMGTPALWRLDMAQLSGPQGSVLLVSTTLAFDWTSR